MNASTTKTSPKAPQLRLYAMANEMRLDVSTIESGAAMPARILIPYGRWPYGMKEVAMGAGGTRKVYVHQSLNQAGAARIEQQLKAALAQGAPGIPVYWGHPDVPELAHKYPDKRAKAWIRGANVTRSGLELHNVEWQAQSEGGFGWFSPYWFGETSFSADGLNAEVAITELHSIALTNDPNIIEFRLANEAGYAAITAGPHDINHGGNATTQGTNTMNREQIIAALGIDAASTDEAIIAEITRLKTVADAAKTKEEAAAAEVAAANTEKEDAKKALANERQARANLLLDSAIADGRISVAGRAAWAAKLKANFQAGEVALANEKPLKTASTTKNLERREDAAVDRLGLANELMTRENITFAAAWARVKATHPDAFKSTTKQG